jgi:outer membrane PBP1 activator LpoA protein
LLGLELVAEPRRRQDLDLIVMLSGPVGARSIRPLLSFLYAGDLPLWSTSQASGARADPRNDGDLEGVRFLDLPWFSGAERPLRESLQRSVPAGGLQRLAALGVDACRLQSRIGLFDWMNGAGLSGATGELVLDTTRRLHRQSQWYVFDNGLAVPEERRTAIFTTTLNARSTEGETPWTDTSAVPPPPPDAPRKTGP